MCLSPPAPSWSPALFNEVICGPVGILLATKALRIYSSLFLKTFAITSVSISMFFPCLRQNACKCLYSPSLNQMQSIYRSQSCCMNLPWLPQLKVVSLLSQLQLCLYSLTTNLAIYHVNCFVTCIHCLDCYLNCVLLDIQYWFDFCLLIIFQGLWE